MSEEALSAEEVEEPTVGVGERDETSTVELVLEDVLTKELTGVAVGCKVVLVVEVGTGRRVLVLNDVCEPTTTELTGKEVSTGVEDWTETVGVGSRGTLAEVEVKELGIEELGGMVGRTGVSGESNT